MDCVDAELTTDVVWYKECVKLTGNILLDHTGTGMRTKNPKLWQPRRAGWRSSQYPDASHCGYDVRS